MEKILWSEYYYCHSCFTEKQLVSGRYRIWTKKTGSKGSSTNHYNTYYLSLSFGSCWKIKIIHFIENILPWRISSTLLWCRCLIIAGCLCYRYLQSWDLNICFMVLLSMKYYPNHEKEVMMLICLIALFYFFVHFS